MIRVLIDAYVLVSALLGLKNPHSTAATIVRLASDGAYTMLLPEELVRGLQQTLETKRWFADRISLEVTREFVASLRDISEPMPVPVAPFPAVCRDPRDDYLLAYAATGQADYLVTGDRDLLDLASGEWPFQILMPAQFLAVLEADR